MRKKTSIIWTISKDILQSYVDTSDSIHSILPKLGISKHSAGSFIQLKKRIKEDSIDISSLVDRAKNKKIEGIKKYSQGIKIPIQEILTENSEYSRTHLKKRLVDEGLKEYKCECCGNNGEWGGKPLNLQLEHKNGINDDNRLENICFLCPNCHSQTETFGSKNKPKKETEKCNSCEKEISKGSNGLCGECYGKSTRLFDVSKSDLENLIMKNPLTRVGKMFGVSDNAIRKRCKKLNIDMSNIRRGCWTKK